jgi:hypothetical protein
MNWWMQLEKTRGSRPRCVSMMSGSPDEIANRLTRLVGHSDVYVSSNDRWMPRGKPVIKTEGKWDTTPADEMILGKPTNLLSQSEQSQLTTWWLAHSVVAGRPNFDIASTCTVDGQKGLLLIEAKAHDVELRGEEAGKKLDANASANSFANHLHIGRAVADAAAAFQRSTGLPWAISRDQRYQMSNRFASACKLTEMGYAVVLVYLGFLNANEMADQGKPFATHDQWNSLVKTHSRPLFQDEVWEAKWKIHGHTFVPLIRSVEWEFNQHV